MSRDPLLRVEQVTKRFGGFRALDGVSLTLAPGEVLGLVGPNGSGKTTCINVISGLYAPDGGGVSFEGAAIAGTPMHRLARLGIRRGPGRAQSSLARHGRAPGCRGLPAVAILG